jgi:hypothetical protein
MDRVQLLQPLPRPFRPGRLAVDSLRGWPPRRVDCFYVQTVTSSGNLTGTTQTSSPAVGVSVCMLMMHACMPVRHSHPLQKATVAAGQAQCLACDRLHLTYPSHPCEESSFLLPRNEEALPFFLAH